MKNRVVAALGAVILTGSLLAGCGNNGTAKEAEPTKESVEEAAEETAEDSEETEETEEQQQEDADAVEESTEPAAEAPIADGVYTAEFHTDSSMFHVNESLDGKGTLTVENGKMTIHISLVSKNIVNLFPGTTEDAQKDGAELLQPTEDTVTYSDGVSEVVYGFDVPVPALDEEFDLALIGTKGVWYDHKVSVTNPEPQE